MEGPMSLVRATLHLEGLVLFGAATWAFFALIEGWWVAFVLLLLVPDVSMIGFVASTRLGAITYNAVHNEALPAAVVVTGIALDARLVIGAGLILAAHVGMDRMLGYGLKYPTAFRDTHLQRL
jgi:hypothetical protein